MWWNSLELSLLLFLIVMCLIVLVKLLWVLLTSALCLILSIEAVIPFKGFRRFLWFSIIEEGLGLVTYFAFICELKPCKFYSLLKRIY